MRRVLEVAIGEAIRTELSAYEVKEACVRLGLPPAAEHGDDPMNSKAWYVRRRLAPLPLWRVVEIGREVADTYGRDEVAEVLTGFGPQGVNGGVRQLIFASVGPKPRLVSASMRPGRHRSRSAACRRSR